MTEGQRMAIGASIAKATDTHLGRARKAIVRRFRCRPNDYSNRQHLKSLKNLTTQTCSLKNLKSASFVLRLLSSWSQHIQKIMWNKQDIFFIKQQRKVEQTLRQRHSNHQISKQQLLVAGRPANLQSMADIPSLVAGPCAKSTMELTRIGRTGATSSKINGGKSLPNQSMQIHDDSNCLQCPGLDSERANAGCQQLQRAYRPKCTLLAEL